MPHQLDFIKRINVIDAIEKISTGKIPKNNEWSEYWINFLGRLYQFKYVVEIASTFTNTPIKTTDFTSNDSSRNYIASLGFQIIYKSPALKDSQTNYWVGASYYGFPGEQMDMFTDFIKGKYWRTDHDLTTGEGFSIYNLLENVKINDRLCIRYLDKRGGNVHIAAMGTVYDIKGISDGKLGVIWDYNAPEFKGKKPAGPGSGNWWKTLFQLKQHSDIALIFGEILIEKRVARIAWNDNGWVMPSGKYGKSVYKDSHEAKYGYGHEEWLFDTSKLINGFHFGFLEPIRKEQAAYTDRLYTVWLFSINGKTKKRFWIGEISNLKAINKEEAENVKKLYIEKGWFAEMEAQIIASGASAKGFSNWKGVDLFNVKFKPNDIYVNDPYFELPDSHPINELSRYSFAHFKDEFQITGDEETDEFGYKSSIDDEEDEKDPETKTHVREPRTIEIVYLHRAISNSLTRSLKQIHGKENVTKEHPAGYGANRIDIVVRDRENLIFYEIKTYNSIKTSIREAFGQLMEYCFYPNKQKAKELIIVTQLPADDQTKFYIKHLRETFKLPIYYQSYDLEAKSLSVKF